MMLRKPKTRYHATVTAGQGDAHIEIGCTDTHRHHTREAAQRCAASTLAEHPSLCSLSPVVNVATR